MLLVTAVILPAMLMTIIATVHPAGSPVLSPAIRLTTDVLMRTVRVMPAVISQHTLVAVTPVMPVIPHMHMIVTVRVMPVHYHLIGTVHIYMSEAWR